jgi:TRAP-type C4-dicarboxylate transport system permease small subunit
MQAAKRGLDLLAGFLMVLGGVALILMMLQIATEVALRAAIKATIPGTEETVTAYYMIACAFLPLAWVQRNRAHVKAEVFTEWMSPRARAALDGVVVLLCALATSVFAYAAFVKAVAMTRTGETLIGTVDVVVWPGRWFVPVGLVAMVLYMVVHAACDLHAAFTGIGSRPAPKPEGH